ncbi:MAG: gamma-glutamylcyclotransferase [Rhodospirillales bacterium CG15_BIG_FIL_POST_REV_8_21_14_020_66_15]|nr:MAG: gamma-glutamylcyclotransferase [Rhodospirillales bacterium CG15_BIG_FIL_POST_REV_8_21_14_020_66_15]
MTEATDTWAPKGPKVLLTPDEKAAGIARVLAERPKGQPFRVFAFGSLMWNPECCVAATIPATVHDYQRRFQIWSTRARGTAERPGLGLCLVPEAGQACRGLVLELDEERLDEDLRCLWDREQNSGVYRPTWIKAEGVDGPVDVMAFVVIRDHPHYVPPMPPDAMAEIMCKAAGRYGTNRDYLARLLETLAALGAEDPDLVELDACIRAKAAG